MVEGSSNIKTPAFTRNTAQDAYAVSESEYFDTGTPTKVYPGYIFVKDKERYIRVFLKDIVFIKANGVYSEVYTHDSKYLVSNCLSGVVKQLEPRYIIRCHRSYAVNICHIEAFWESSLFVGIDQISVPVGLKFKHKVFDLLPVLRSQ